MWTSGAPTPAIKLLLSDAAAILESAGIETPLLDAEVMLSEAMGVPRAYVLAHPEADPPSPAVHCFQLWLRLREQRVPLAYIVGHREFYGLDFEITPAVLVPRPETEVLVEATLADLKDTEAPIVAEIGVGSGAVAVSLAKAMSAAKVFGTDRSADALEVARRNVEKHSLGDRLELRIGDLLEPLAGLTFDAIVSNPPYVETAEISGLQPEIARYEPREALDGGSDGLDCCRRIASDAPRYLRSGGQLLLEVGQGQAESVKAMLASGGFADVRSIRDLGGVERVVTGRQNCPP